MVLALKPSIMCHGDTHISDHARNHLVEVGLNARRRNHDVVSFDATPEGRVARKQQMRSDVGSVVVAVVPELERLAPRNVVELVGPDVVACVGTIVATFVLAVFIEQMGMELVVGPTRIALDSLVFHGGNENDSVTHDAGAMADIARPTSHREVCNGPTEQWRTMFDTPQCGPDGKRGDVWGQELRKQKVLGHQSILLGSKPKTSFYII